MPLEQYGYNMDALYDMRSALYDVRTVQCGMGVLCDMRSALYESVLYDKSYIIIDSL